MAHVLASSFQQPRRLAAVVDTWPKLDAHVKLAILALVDTSR